ncbi:O-antigen ligase family protein [Natronorarus salvus]|uniref:O-antigen ligase family protein n=1 Tax=Natronorarus salvus TaxID=3117733 RepID=UPI002F26B1D1
MDRYVHAAFGLLLVLLLSMGFTSVGPIHLALLGVFIGFLAFNQYDYRTGGVDTSIFLLAQFGLTLLLGFTVTWQALGAFENSVFALVLLWLSLLGYLIVQHDALSYVSQTFPYLLCFGVVFAVFLYHTLPVAPGGGLAVFAVSAGVLLGLNLFVFPRYVSPRLFLWTIAAFGGVLAFVGLPSAFDRSYTVWFLAVEPWENTITPPMLDREFSVVRSAFGNPNTFGIVVFAGTVAAFVEAIRSLERGAALGALLMVGLLGVNLVGLYLSNSRASWLAAGVGVTIYAAYSLLDWRAVPVAAVGIAILVPAFLVGIYLSIVPIDPANRFELWRASLSAIRENPTLAGQGIVSTSDVIAPYVPDGIGQPSPHNSYLSIWIRTGLLGVAAYTLLIFGSILHGLAKARTVDVAALALACGFAVSQFFEAYTLYHTGPGSVIGALAFGYLIASVAEPDRFDAAASDAPTGDERRVEAPSLADLSGDRRPAGVDRSFERGEGGRSARGGESTTDGGLSTRR